MPGKKNILTCIWEEDWGNAIYKRHRGVYSKTIISKKIECDPEERSIKVSTCIPRSKKIISKK